MSQDDNPRYILITVDCPSGKRVLGGGGAIETTGGAVSYQGRLEASLPLDDNTWYVIIYYRGGDPSGLQQKAYAICANVD